MKTHRRSYLKTVVAALGLSMALLAAGGYGLAEGRLPVALRWASAGSLVTLALLCLLVGAGGLIALHEDAREDRGRQAEP